MDRLARLTPAFCVLLLTSCVTNSRVITDPPGLGVFINGKDFGKSPCDIQSVGTTFGQYILELKDGSGTLLHRQDLPKNIRIWGIFWPPYGVFYNMYEFYPQYTVRRTKASSGETIWTVNPF